MVDYFKPLLEKKDTEELLQALNDPDAWSKDAYEAIKCITIVRLKTLVNTAVLVIGGLRFVVDVEQRPVKWAYSRKARCSESVILCKGLWADEAAFG